MEEMSSRPSLLESPLSYVSPGICSMTVWYRRVSVRVRLVYRSGSLSYSPCRSLSAHC